MNREILFRGKRLDNGKWAQGSLLSFDYGGKTILPSTAKVFKQSGTTTICCNECHDVDPNTVGQYTGLTDKNGVKIFEGDIVRYIYEPGEGFWNANQLSVVVWEHTGFKLDGIIGTNKFALLQGWLVSVPCEKSYFEVIGNIHDNPEILG